MTDFERSTPGSACRWSSSPGHSGRDKIVAAIASGHPPDLCELGSTSMPRFLESGSPGRLERRGGRSQAHAARLGARVRSATRSTGCPGCWGRARCSATRHCSRAPGLDSSRAPDTWGELREAAGGSSALGHGVHGYGVARGRAADPVQEVHAVRVGKRRRRSCRDDLTRSRSIRPAISRRSEFYLSLRAVGTLGQQDALDQEFKQGRLGLEISGAWLFRSIAKKAPELRYGVALVPRPAADRGTHASFAGGEVLVSFGACRRRRTRSSWPGSSCVPTTSRRSPRPPASVQPATVGADTRAYYRDAPSSRS